MKHFFKFCTKVKNIRAKRFFSRKQINNEKTRLVKDKIVFLYAIRTKFVSIFDLSIFDKSVALSGRVFSLQNRDQ